MRLLILNIVAVLGCMLFQSSLVIAAITTDDAIVSVKSYGFVDLEGAKISAIIVEYNRMIDAKSVRTTTYKIRNYVIAQEEANGFDRTVEQDGDGIKGNEGQITRVYVNGKPMPSLSGGTKSGKYVIIEVNTKYMLSGQNLTYTESMMAGVTQVEPIRAEGTIINAATKEIKNYTSEQQQGFGPGGGKRTVVNTKKSSIILPEFGKGSGWTLHYIGNGAFKATHGYSEYTGKYEDFELPYSIYVPDQKTMEAAKGHISLVIHMEHAGANDTDPMSAITSSKAAVKLSGKVVQTKNPAIVVVPQVEQSRRSTNDFDASSEVNTAAWELIDSLLKEYKDYIDVNRIYGTGQSMGGMTILAMAAQRDNFFAGIAVVGAQWSNNYDKPLQNNGSPVRTPDNDKISFNGFGLDRENFQNWYYMISDDNILVHTCAGDPMAGGEWKDLTDYYKAAGVTVAYDQWDPYLPITEQNRRDSVLTSHNNTALGSGISWGAFTRGSHMSTWKYGYQLDNPFKWLFAQNRQSEMKRGKIEQLKNKWLGRDQNGNIVKDSGTTGLNSAQFTPGGASKIFTEGWTPASVAKSKVTNEKQDH
jgi:predicted peptidase